MKNRPRRDNDKKMITKKSVKSSHSNQSFLGIVSQISFLWLFLIILLIVSLGLFVTRLSIYEFFNRNFTSRSIFTFCFYLILIFGVTGLIKGILDLFVLGLEVNANYDLQDFRYKQKVHQIANGLLFIFGSLLFIWLL